MKDDLPKIKRAIKPITFVGRLGQLKTLKNGDVTIVLSANALEFSKIFKLAAACQVGSSLLISAQIMKPKTVKKDAKEKSNTQNQKGPRRVRRYPYK